MRLSWKSWEVRFWVKWIGGILLLVTVLAQAMALCRANNNESSRKYRATHQCAIVGVSGGSRYEEPSVIYQCTDGKLLKEYP